ncbi:MAG: alpha/beta fold hydrolase, partial [Gammaproteobacteria bacterium]
MIDYNVGVTVSKRIDIKKLDLDYFTESQRWETAQKGKPCSGSKPFVDEVPERFRPARKLLRAVAELHTRGYRRLRVAVSPHATDSAIEPIVEIAVPRPTHWVEATLNPSNRSFRMKTAVRIGLATAALALAIVPLAVAQEAPKPDSSGYVTANGVKYWFEIHGKGEPLLLLHGGLGSTGMYGPVLSKLAETRRVIGVDLHGHGRTELGTRKINLIDIANDLAVIVRALGLQQVDAVGYSFGGGAALRLAVQHPTLVRRLVVASAPYAQNGFFPEMLPQQAAVGAAMADMMKETPMYKSYAAIAPRVLDFPKLLDAMGEYMRQPYDWSADVKKLAMPVLLVFGD